MDDLLCTSPVAQWDAPCEILACHLMFYRWWTVHIISLCEELTEIGSSPVWLFHAQRFGLILSLTRVRESLEKSEPLWLYNNHPVWLHTWPFSLSSSGREFATMLALVVFCLRSRFFFLSGMLEPNWVWVFFTHLCCEFMRIFWFVLDKFTPQLINMAAIIFKTAPDISYRL